MNDVKAMVKDIKEEYKEDENSCLAAINLRYLFFFNLIEKKMNAVILD